MLCQKSLVTSIACCGTQLILKAGLANNTSYFWVITCKRTGIIYQRQVTTNNSGDLIIDLTALPDGLIHKYAGLFELRIKEGPNYLNTIKMLLLGEQHETIFFNCVEINNSVPLNFTISTEAILSNPNNTNNDNYTQQALIVATNGQTSFLLLQSIQNASNTFLFVNGQERSIGVDYNISGTILTWLSNSYTLETTDEVIFYYK